MCEYSRFNKLNVRNKAVVAGEQWLKITTRLQEVTVPASTPPEGSWEMRAQVSRTTSAAPAPCAGRDAAPPTAAPSSPPPKQKRG